MRHPPRLAGTLNRGTRASGVVLERGEREEKSVISFWRGASRVQARGEGGLLSGCSEVGGMGAHFSSGSSVRPTASDRMPRLPSSSTCRHRAPSPTAW